MVRSDLRRILLRIVFFLEDPPGLRRCQGLPHRGGLVLDDEHIGTHRRLRFASPLLPLLNGPRLEPVAFRELLAGEPVLRGFDVSCRNPGVCFGVYPKSAS